MKRSLAAFVLVSALTLGFSLSAPAGTLVINANTSDPAPRAAWAAAVQQFQKEHPDIVVKLNVYDHESYKKALRNWLTSAPPDVVFWNVGNRMRQFVTPGLLADVSDVFTAEVRAALPQAAIELVTVEGKQYGVPYAYYHTGLFFRRDLLANVGVAQGPRTWGEFLATCDRLKAVGIAPIAIGSKDLWPTAAWFDYLNLRLNGRAFHMDLMNGTVAYTDGRVRAVFAKWQELLDRECFVRNHAAASWQESQALLYQGKAAMMLIGSFIVPNFPPEVRDRMDFVRFPTMAPDAGRYEEAPMNSLHVPADARNKVDAKRFLSFVLRADVQEAINKALLHLPVNRKAAIAEDRFLVMGRELLAEADGLTQFFDRDTSEELAVLAMKGFQEFMIKPDRLDSVLERIERARQRIYRP